VGTLFPVRDRLFRTTSRTFFVADCAACRLRFLSPQPAPEELATFYPKGYWVGPTAGGDRSLLAHLTEFYRAVVLFDHVRFVRGVVERQRLDGTWRRLLDIGCGDGSFLKALAARPCVGLDWSIDALRAVRARDIAAVRGELTTAPLALGSCSVVTMLHVLEHVAPAQPTLEAVRRLLTPGGSLVVQVPNADAWQARILGRHWAGYDPPRHLIDYSAQTLIATLARHGFQVTRVTHFSLRDNPTTIANSLAPSLYPPSRLARGASRFEWLARLGYLGLVLASLPWTLVESAIGRGAAVMVEARPGT
jgi:SAM-dependent methyltransferase